MPTGKGLRVQGFHCRSGRCGRLLYIEFPSGVSDLLVKSGIVSAVALALMSQAVLAQQEPSPAPVKSPSPSPAAAPATQVQTSPIPDAKLRTMTRARDEKVALRAIGRNWFPPKCNPCPKPTVIRIKLDTHGSVVEKFIVASSGVKIFDQAAMNAIEYQSTAFPPLRTVYPDGWLEVVFDGNIYHSDAVALRAVKNGGQPPVGTDKQSGDGLARITGKVVGTRSATSDETHSSK